MLPDRVPEEGDLGGIAGYTSAPLDDCRRPLLDRLAKITTAVMPVYLTAKAIGSSGVGDFRRADSAAGNFDARWRPLHVHERLANREPELRVQA